nr:hypothetical protein B5O22.50 [imported] - Neurospora crassa [Neurospora crassa]
MEIDIMEERKVLDGSLVAELPQHSTLAAYKCKHELAAEERWAQVREERKKEKEEELGATSRLIYENFGGGVCASGAKPALQVSVDTAYYGEMGKLNPWIRSSTTQCSRSSGCGGPCKIPDKGVLLLLATAVHTA